MPFTRRRVVSALAFALSAAPALAQDEAAQKAKKLPAKKPVATPPVPDVPPVPLTISQGAAKVFGANGPDLPAILLDGRYAPVIRVKQGEQFAFRIENGLDQPTALHMHGLNLPNSLDGTPGLTQPAIAPKGVQDFRFTPKDSGLAVLRASLDQDGMGRRQWEQGLAGLLVVEEPNPQPADQDIALVFHDLSHRILERDAALKLLDEKKTPEEREKAAKEPKPAARPVPVFANGAELVSIPVKTGERIRLRLANLSAARLLQFTAPGHAISMLALDGAPSDSFQIDKSILLLAPGQTADVMLDCLMAPGTYAPIFVGNGEGKAEVARLVYGPEPIKRETPLPPVAALPQISTLMMELNFSRAYRSTLTLTAKDGKVLLNGRDRGRGASFLKANEKSVVMLTLENKTDLIQCFHLHGHLVRLLDDLDDGWKPYWISSVTIPAGAVGRIAFLADRPGRWQIDATAMNGPEQNLSGWFEVISTTAAKKLKDKGKDDGAVVSDEANASVSSYLPMEPDSR